MAAATLPCERVQIPQDKADHEAAHREQLDKDDREALVPPRPLTSGAGLHRERRLLGAGPRQTPFASLQAREEIDHPGETTRIRIDIGE